MREIMAAEEPEFQKLAGECDEIMKNNFITTATARGIARFEKLLKITPRADADIESRRSTVMTRWWDVVPYTIRTLKNRIAMIQGNDDVQISFSEQNPYLIQIVTRLETAGQVDDLIYILGTMLPANLEMELSNRLEINLDIQVFYGIGASVTGTLVMPGDSGKNTLEFY